MYVCYADDLFHERIVLAWVANGEYVVATPDYDVYIEQLGATNGDLTALRFGDQHGNLPVGVAGRPVYAFAPRPTGLALQQVLREGESHARTERLARGLVGDPAGLPLAGAALPPVVVPIALPVVALAMPQAAGGLAQVVQPALPPLRRFADAGGTWVLDEPIGVYQVGQEVVLPPGALDCGGGAFVRVNDSVVSLTRVAAGADLDDYPPATLLGFSTLTVESSRCRLVVARLPCRERSSTNVDEEGPGHVSEPQGPQHHG